MLSVIRDSVLNIWPVVISWRAVRMSCEGEVGWGVGVVFVPVTLQEVPKATETTSQSEYLAPPQLLLTCLHPLLTPRANTKHQIILFYLPFRQPEWPRLNLPHDPHSLSSDTYTPSL